MKFCCEILALFALQPMGGTAFSIPGPKILKPSISLHASSMQDFGRPTPLSDNTVDFDTSNIPDAIERNNSPESSPPERWDLSPVVRVEGGTLRTWGFGDVSRDVLQVSMTTDGRPQNADIELWIGPDWTPFKLKVYSEDGLVRPCQTMIGTRNKANTVSIRNIDNLQHPFDAACAYALPPLSDLTKKIPKMSNGQKVQGGAIRTQPFLPDIDQVQVLLNTDGRQLHARIELLNAPNNVKQSFEVFTNNGMLNPFYVLMDCPGSGNVVRIVNLASVEFPCHAYISEA